MADWFYVRIPDGRHLRLQTVRDRLKAAKAVTSVKQVARGTEELPGAIWAVVRTRSVKAETLRSQVEGADLVQKIVKPDQGEAMSKQLGLF
jgi:hypothetical protein